MKPLKKVEYYYELDQQIVSFYVQMVKSGPWLENKASNQEMSDSDEPSAIEDSSHAREEAGNW